jgi:hypothetical protein
MAKGSVHYTKVQGPRILGTLYAVLADDDNVTKAEQMPDGGRLFAFDHYKSQRSDLDLAWLSVTVGMSSSRRLPLARAANRICVEHRLAH